MIPPPIHSIEVEYLEKGTFVGSEEDASDLSISPDQTCHVITTAERDRVNSHLQSIENLNEHAGFGSDTLYATIIYPRSQERLIKHIQIELWDTRAADDLRIHFDFGRDVWSVCQLNRETDQWIETAALPTYPFETE